MNEIQIAVLFFEPGYVTISLESCNVIENVEEI